MIGLLLAAATEVHPFSLDSLLPPPAKPDEGKCDRDTLATTAPPRPVGLREILRTIDVGVRSYTDIRVATEDTDSIDSATRGNTFPFVPAGNLEQNRWFLELSWSQSLDCLLQDYLPKATARLDYTLAYRGEYDGIYDYGPTAFSTSRETLEEIRTSLGVRRPPPNGYPVDTAVAANRFNRQRLLDQARFRNRLFQAFVDYETGFAPSARADLILGRQIVHWGDTVLANTNPLDLSFGGFFLRHDLTDPLSFEDERRVPLNVARLVYSAPEQWPSDWFTGLSLDSYAAIDTTVGFVPGIPAGSPWDVPEGPQDGYIRNRRRDNPIGDLRGGVRLNVQGPNVVWPALLSKPLPLRFSLSNYWTILDAPALRLVPVVKNLAVLSSFPKFLAYQFGPRVQVIGASLDAKPLIDPDFRGTPSISDYWLSPVEAAFIRDEPLFRGARTQTELAPFRAQLLHCAVFPKDCKYSFDSVSFKDTFNLTLGFDAWDFRPLKSFGRMHVTPAIYYKHIFDIDPLQAFPIPHADNRNLVIPQVANQILNVLDVSWRLGPWGNRKNILAKAGVLFVYDWQGSTLAQPRLELLVTNVWTRGSGPDLRLLVDYTNVQSGQLRAPIGIFRDRDNVRVQIELRTTPTRQVPRLSPLEYIL